MNLYSQWGYLFLADRTPIDPQPEVAGIFNGSLHSYMEEGWEDDLIGPEDE